MSTYTLKEAASLKNPEAWIALMQIEYKCDHEKPQNFNKVQIHQLKHTRWKTEIADCKKKSSIPTVKSALFERQENLTMATEWKGQ